MNSPFAKVSLASIAALLVVWIAGALFIDHKTAAAEKAYREKHILIGRYESLKDLWSEKSQRHALKKFKTLLRLYGITPDIRKRRNRKIYTFRLEKKNADSVLTKLLNSNLAISTFKVRKIDRQHIEVSVGVSV
ncbi:hypothetical protein [Hydrogenimonas sp.]|uniref:hypothetical protein n=1 Tax=Hydrogenimonas sp. TaxID=2231112 RepID=UPI002623E2E3|nr:hypothetical protein [Hydrogenimonas sp.]